MDYKQHVIKDQRLTMLRLLHEAHGFDLNDTIIGAGLMEFGHRLSNDALHTQLAWLAEQGLLTTQVVCGGTTWVAQLTRRGEDVATGCASVPGVRKYRPYE